MPTPPDELLQQTSTHPLGRIVLTGLHFGHRQDKPMPLRVWDTYALVYVLGGQAQFRDVTGLNLRLRPGDLLLTFPRHGYQYRVDPHEPWNEFYLQFQGPIFDLWRDMKVIDPARPVFHVEPIETWLGRLRALVSATQPTHSFDVLRQICDLQSLLTDAMDAAANDAVAQRDLWLTHACQHIDAVRIQRKPDWSAIAAKMGLSHDRFRKRFATLSGVTPAKYFMAPRGHRACEMLRNRTISMKTIATACGFCDVYHMSKRFKQNIYLTPGQFRRQKL